jgi:glutathione peroxidase
MSIRTLATLGLVAVALALAPGAMTFASAKRTVYDFKMKSIDGKSTPLAKYKGKVLLIVNTASKCGYTPQYEGLESLYEKYRERGFEVLAFPANDFGQQEPGTDAQIAEFCSLNYQTTFPLFSKITVKGKGIHPLYAYLTKESPFPGEIKWNFNKFLVGPDGQVAARFDSKVEPLSADVTDAIDKLMGQEASR